MGSRSNTTQSLPAWAKPWANTLLPTATGLTAPGADPSLTQGALPLKPYDPALSQQVAGFNPTQLAGLGALGGTAAPSLALAGSGVNQLEKTLSGDYLSPGSNPFLDQTYSAAARNMTDQYQMATAPSNAIAAQQAGVGGGSADQQNQALSRFGLGQNLSDLATQIYGGNYAQERGLQNSAMSAIPGMQGALAAPGQQLLGAGTLQQSQTQTELDFAQKNAQAKEEYPYTLLSYLGNMLQTATTGGGQSTAGTSK